MTDLRHLLDQYLAATGLDPAKNGQHDSLFFDTAAGLSLGVIDMPKGGIRLFACPGFVSADQLRGLHVDEETDIDEEDAEEPQDPFDCLDQDAVVRWSVQGAGWAIAVEPASGAATLSMYLGEAPRRPSEWHTRLDEFAYQFNDWQGRLQDEAPPLSRTGTQPASWMSAGLALRC